MIDCVKVQPHLLIVNLATIGAFLDLFGADFGVGVRLKKSWDLPMQTINFGF